ncbi:hypothetical protein AUC68_07345 [Methyloceanibacter methanicus]|uniref:Uncharacterized protein n=2 Tax=Methyloceanibacter methanicus TaxID=1774968 RepID=A0A1E3W1F1_9HYPH|nr:hypothetical protein AUC68_07345 [Methyloceanibacter methanicus]
MLLALVNGTAVLVIVAALLALAATAKVTHLAETVAATMTDAVLARVDVKPGRVKAQLGNLTAEIQALRTALQEKEAEKRAALDPAIAQLNARLEALETAIGQLSDARSRLLDAATARLSLSFGEALQDFGACKMRAPSP